MRLKNRVNLGVAAVFLLMTMPYSADGWNLHTVTQEIGANCGLQESNQIARVHLDESISIGDR
jgi:hypothetical protein